MIWLISCVMTLSSSSEMHREQWGVGHQLGKPMTSKIEQSASAIVSLIHRLAMTMRELLLPGRIRLV